MKQLFAGFVVSCVVAGLSSTASAAIINGSDFNADTRISLPNGVSATVGNSVQFSGLPTFASVLVEVALAEFGFGTDVGESTSGTIAINSTRISEDSDFYFGLWDGTNFASLAFFDGERVYGPMANGSSNGTTVVPDFSGGTVFGTSTQSVGAATVSLFGFDLLADALTLNAVGANVGGTLGALNTGNDLSFLIALDTSNESHQIDSLEIRGGIDGGNGGQSVPAPATLALFGLGLAGLGLSRRKKK